MASFSSGSVEKRISLVGKLLEIHVFVQGYCWLTPQFQATHSSISTLTTAKLKYSTFIGRFEKKKSLFAFSFQRVIISPLDCFIWKETLSAHSHYHPNVKFAYLFVCHSIILSKTGRSILCFENKRCRMRWCYREILCIAKLGSSHRM